MIAELFFRDYSRVLRHFATTRGPEVLALQASPVVGVVLGGFSLEWWSGMQLGLLLLGSLSLTAHVFVLNDWAGYSTDIDDLQRSKFVFIRQGITRRQVAVFAIVLLMLAYAALTAVGMAAILLGTVIAVISFLYSCSESVGKRAPILSSVNHLLGGALHFLLGYTLFNPLDARGLVISLFFGLVFAGGHLNQEVRDFEGDFRNGICTNAVMFGCRRTFIASLCVFTLAYALVTGLAVLGELPKLLLLSPLLWFSHLAWSFQALQRGLRFETALWMRRRYHMLYACVGLAMLT